MSREYRGREQIGQTRSIMHTIRHAVGDILLTGLVFVVFGVLLTEVLSIVLTRTLPTVYVHIAAAAIGLILGYAAAVTVALREMVRVVMATLEGIVTEIEHAGSQLARSVEVFSHDQGSHYGDLSQPSRPEPRGSVSSLREGSITGLPATMVRPLDHMVEVAGGSQRE